MIKSIAQLDMTMIMISEALSAQSCAAMLSSTTSGSGPYVFLSGTRSCTIASDAVVRMKFTTMKRKAVKREKAAVYTVDSDHGSVPDPAPT